MGLGFYAKRTGAPQRHHGGTRLSDRFAVVLCTLVLAMAQGCGFTKTSVVSLERSTVLQGNVHGGRQPIANALIQLYAAGQSGVASAATPLLTQAVHTGSDGSFALAGSYTCPSVSAPVYLVARGGNPGLHTGVNAAITLMAAIGSCGTLNGLTNVTLNEVTTVGAVFALAPFMTSYAEVGTDPSLADQFAGVWAQALELADPVAGTSPGPNAISFASVPVAKINTLANILATCINSNGGSAGDGTLCGQLFNYTATNGATPTDTTNALLQIARNPTSQVRNLFGLSGPLGPFEPQLVVAPADWGLYSSVGIPLAVALPAAPGPVDPAPPVLPPVIPPAPVPDPVPVPVIPVPSPPVVTPPSPSGVVWYVRPDGGTPYSANRANHPEYGFTAQCDGKHDDSYAHALSVASGGQTTNLPCAFSRFSYLYDDQATYGSLVWVVQPGDTVILRQNIVSGANVAYRIGLGSDSVSARNCWGVVPQGCVPPPIPSGLDAAHPTRVLGENWAACDASSDPADSDWDRKPDVSKLTLLAGGGGAYYDLSLEGSHYVEVRCLGLKNFDSQCQLQGSPNINGCHPAPANDYVNDGLKYGTGTYGATLDNVTIMGMSSRGIHGDPSYTGSSYNSTTDRITQRHVWLFANTQSSEDFDTNPPDGPLEVFVDHNLFGWAGCQLKNNPPFPFPRTVAQEAADITRCYSQNAGVVADQFAIGDNSGMDVHILDSTFRYGTQDGIDFGHMGNGQHTLEIARTKFTSHTGSPFKWGPGFHTINAYDNLVVDNCARPVYAVPGADSTVIQYDGDVCRSGDAIAFLMGADSTTNLIHNTYLTISPTLIDAGCVTDNSHNCNATTINVMDNIFIALAEPALLPPADRYNGNGAPGGYCIGACRGTDSYSGNNPGAQGVWNRKNNIYMGQRACYANQIAGGTYAENLSGEICASGPVLTAQPTSLASYLDVVNFALLTSGAAYHAGVSTTIATDFTGAAFALAPSTGALEAGSAASITLDPTLTSATLSVPTTVTTGSPFTATLTVSPAGTAGDCQFLTNNRNLVLGTGTISGATCSATLILPSDGTYSIIADLRPGPAYAPSAARASTTASTAPSH